MLTQSPSAGGTTLCKAVCIKSIRSRISTCSSLHGQIFGPTFAGWISDLRTSDGYYESAINDIFAMTAGTARIYTAFSGVTAAGNNPLTLPTIYAFNNYPIRTHRENARRNF
jgi:hypothetical protein